MQNGGKSKCDCMQSPAQGVGCGNPGKNMGIVQHKGKPGLQYAGQQREDQAWNPMVGQHSEAHSWNSVCGTRKGGSHTESKVWEKAESIACKIDCMGQCRRIAHGIQCTGQCGEDCMQPPIHETTQRRLCRVSNTWEKAERIVWGVQYAREHAEVCTEPPICQKRERIAYEIQCMGQCGEDCAWKRRCRTTQRASNVWKQMHTWDNPERHTQSIQFTGQCGEAYATSNKLENVARQVCSLRYEGQEREPGTWLPIHGTTWRRVHLDSDKWDNLKKLTYGTK